MPTLATDASPPRAPRRPTHVSRPDGVVEDPYAWLRERDDPAVRAYLEAENAHTEAALAPLGDLRETLFQELRGRVRETDATAPLLDGGWLYYRRTLAEQAYPIHCRRPAPAGITDPRELPVALRRPVDAAAPPDDEVVLLDENAAAAGHDFFRLGGYAISPDHRLAAEAVDLTGAEILTIRFRDLTTGELLADEIPRAGYGLAWYDDASALLYTVTDDAWRPHQVWRHRLGTDPAEDELVLSEPDERFWLGIGRTRSDRYLAVHAGSATTSEWSLLPADDPTAPARVVVPRRAGVEVDLDHGGDRLYLVANDAGAEDFRCCVVAVADAPDVSAWRELVPHRPGVRLESVAAFATHLVLSERAEAGTRLRVCDPETGVGEVLDVGPLLGGDPTVGVTGLASNPSFTTRVLRLATTSLTTPVRTVEVDLDDGEALLLAEQPVGGGFDRDAYVSWREWAEAPDGTRIPISLVRRRGTPADGTAPGIVYGYGAYEHSVDPVFAPSRLSWLDRGGVFAIAHVRGGGECGRPWYDQGRLAAKPNSFGDLAACVDHLVAAGTIARERTAIRGGSAGGLLVGATLNLRPDLCAAAVAEVPFVDLLNTMADASLPLTVTEYDEWGDPSEPEQYAVMASYSPYDNLAARAYPALYVTAGLNDTRVQYWEPAKWVARLRATMTGGGPVLLDTKLGAGHAGRSGRYDAWRDEATVLAFLVAVLGAPATPGG